MSSKPQPAPDLVNIVSSHMPLVNKRKDFYQGYCPFCPNSEETFFLRGSLGEWFCYNCGTGGDVYDFVARMYGVSRSESFGIIRELVAVSPQDNPDQSQRPAEPVAAAPEPPAADHETPDSANPGAAPAAPQSDDAYWQGVLRRLKTLKGYRSAAVVNSLGPVLADDGEGMAMSHHLVDLVPLAQAVFDDTETLFAPAQEPGKRVYCITMASSQGAWLALRCGTPPDANYVVLMLGESGAVPAARLQLLAIAAPP